MVPIRDERAWYWVTAKRRDDVGCAVVLDGRLDGWAACSLWFNTVKTELAKIEWINDDVNSTRRIFSVT